MILGKRQTSDRTGHRGSPPLRGSYSEALNLCTSSYHYIILDRKDLTRNYQRGAMNVCILDNVIPMHTTL